MQSKVMRLSAVAVLLMAAAVLLAPQAAHASGNCYSQSDGNWSSISWWCSTPGGLRALQTDDDVVIQHNVTLDVDATVRGVTVDSTKTFNNGSKTLTAAAGYFTNNGTYNRDTGTYSFTASGGVYGSSTTTFNNAIISSGVNFKGGSNTAIINGTLTINSGGYVNTNPPIYGSSSTLKYNSGGTYGRGLEWSATSGAGYPNHVQIGNGTTLDLHNGSSALRQMAGNLAIDSGGALSMGSMTHALVVLGNVTADGTLTLSTGGGGDLTVGGNWTRTGTFNHNSREVTFNGASGQTLNGATTFAYLYVNNASSTGVSLNAATTVNNRLKLGGLVTLGSNNLIVDAGASVQDGSGGSTFSATNMVMATGSGEFRRGFTGTGSFTFPVGDNTSTAEYSPVTLNFSSGSFSSAYAAVRLTDAKHPNNTSTTHFVTRYWTVTTSGISSFSCDASFFYVDADITGTESSIYTGKWNGSAWTLLNAADTGTNKLSGTVTSFSAFTGGEQTPMAATLASFDAAQVGEAIRVSWETVSELNNLGFNLWRGTNPAAPDQQLNASLIPSQGPGSGQGFSYEWLDSANLVNNTTYYYWLEDMDISGQTTRHGPVSATYEAPTAVRLSGANVGWSGSGAALLLCGAAGLLALALAMRKRHHPT